ncbi:hypothetical protein K490DRAFT_58907 [Saccharata proteae CBS 121410]|uniref:Uncharacterized protein n=1 Tax=Saccharata proteae CBS 121410 TaxID=1314787 RepID=A0A9P4HRE0_9PEZI|nr:hypothetical protein K490DRAFT_58907 [Saccharata proteae CBS 121410]
MDDGRWLMREPTGLLACCGCEALAIRDQMLDQVDAGQPASFGCSSSSSSSSSRTADDGQTDNGQRTADSGQRTADRRQATGDRRQAVVGRDSGARVRVYTRTTHRASLMRKERTCETRTRLLAAMASGS